MLLKDVKGIKNKNVDITKIIHNNKIIWGSNVYMAKDSDFVKIDGYWVYKGSELEVEIPEYINGTLVTNCKFMFGSFSIHNATPVTKVVLRHNNVTNMNYMFYSSPSTTLDLSSFNISNVTDMEGMFSLSSATKGYARTQADANRFNASSNKPSGLTFVVK